MKKSVTVQLELSPAIKAEIDKGTITREKLGEYIQHNFQQYHNLKNEAKMNGPDRARFVNEMMDHHLEALNSDDNKDTATAISCKRGCSHCCYIEVFVTWDEAALLLEVAGDEIDWDKVNDQLPGHQNIAHYKRACVFLKNNECSVHENRPMSCRKYFVVNDPDKCDSKKYPKGQTETVYLQPAELLASSMMTIQETGTMAQMLTKVRARMKL